MDFFQGSLPPNFISFCLENQNVDELEVQTNITAGNSTGPSQRPVPISMPDAAPNSAPLPPPFPPTRIALSQISQIAANSPFTNDSSVDVTAYADEVVQRMEASQEHVGTDPLRLRTKKPKM